MRFQKRDIFESKVLLAEEQDVVPIRRANSKYGMNTGGWFSTRDHVAKR